MADNNFNLTTDPWIKVLNKATNQQEVVSLIDLFENAQNYTQLAGEMRSQDLAILRLLLAVLTTVYSRFDANDNPYKWLKIDNDTMQASQDLKPMKYTNKMKKQLLKTWQQLYREGKGHFTRAVTSYLQKHANQFDVFGEHPFYQVTQSEYNQLVPNKKQIVGGKGPGTVSVKQINRQISESNNTPSLFTPKTDNFKNDVNLDEFVRWLITYQNFTGVTDKTKIETEEKFSASAGWLYKLNPVFADGDTLFQTLMLNLVLISENSPYSAQKPVWEYRDVQSYVAKLKKQSVPDNVAALYTTWSRLLHVNWNEDGRPTIFSAALPTLNHDNAFIEPMTVWKLDKKTNYYKPAVKGLRSIETAMWRDFGQYVDVNGSDDTHEPGVVRWLNELKSQKFLSRSTLLTLASVALISDGNATSQSPVAEVYDDMHINADVLFDENPDKAQRWPIRIEDMIELTQKVGSDYWRFAANIAHIRNLDYRPFANKMSAAFYDGLNGPFNKWLQSLTNEEDRDKKSNEWKKELKSYVLKTANEVIQSSSPRDMAGFIDVNGVVDKSKGLVNIFTVNNRLRYQVQADLKS